MTRLAPLAVVALLGGCTLVAPYPDAADELCDGRGHDEDLDGRVDCDDPDCWGRCPEESLRACTNGVDDDGDHRVDAADARCWPYARVTVERCATIHGTDTDLVSLITETWHQTGASTSAPDPTSPSNEVLALDGLQTTLTTERVLTGQWAGTVVTLRVWVEGAAHAFVDLPYEASPSALDHPALTLAADGLAVRWGDFSESTGLAPVDGWVQVTLRIEQGADALAAHASILRESDGARAEASAQTFPGFPPADPIRLAVTLAVGEGETGRALFDYAHVRRDHYTGGCAAPVGELESPPGAVVRADDGSLCAFVRSSAPLGGVSLRRSRDEGTTWSEEPLSGPSVWSLLRMVRDPAGTGLVGAARVDAADPAVHALHATSDCTTLTDEGPALADGEPLLEAHRIALTVREDLVNAMPVRWLDLWSISAASGGLLYASSPSGAAGSYRIAGGVALASGMHASDPAFDPRTTVATFGRDHVWVAPSSVGATAGRPAPTVDLFVESAAGLVAVGAALGASGIAGRYDADCVDEVTLVEGPSLAAGTFTGHALVRCGSGPTAVLPFRVEPLGP